MVKKIKKRHKKSKARHKDPTQVIFEHWRQIVDTHKVRLLDPAFTFTAHHSTSIPKDFFTDPKVNHTAKKAMQTFIDHELNESQLQYHVYDGHNFTNLLAGAKGARDLKFISQSQYLYWGELDMVIYLNRIRFFKFIKNILSTSLTESNPIILGFMLRSIIETSVSCCYYLAGIITAKKALSTHEELDQLQHYILRSKSIENFVRGLNDIKAQRVEAIDLFTRIENLMAQVDDTAGVGENQATLDKSGKILKEFFRHQKAGSAIKSYDILSKLYIFACGLVHTTPLSLSLDCPYETRLNIGSRELKSLIGTACHHCEHILSQVGFYEGTGDSFISLIQPESLMYADFYQLRFPIMEQLKNRNQNVKITHFESERDHQWEIKVNQTLDQLYMQHRMF